MEIQTNRIIIGVDHIETHSMCPEVKWLVHGCQEVCWLHCSTRVLTTCLVFVRWVVCTFVIMSRLDLHVRRTSMRHVDITSHQLPLYSGLSNMWTFVMILSPVTVRSIQFGLISCTFTQVAKFKWTPILTCVSETNNSFTSLFVCFVLSPSPVGLYYSVFPSNDIPHNAINNFIYSSRNWRIFQVTTERGRLFGRCKSSVI